MKRFWGNKSSSHMAWRFTTRQLMGLKKDLGRFLSLQPEQNTGSCCQDIIVWVTVRLFIMPWEQQGEGHTGEGQFSQSGAQGEVSREGLDE